MSDVDLIVLDLDGGPLLEECLVSIERQTLAPSRVIVFDNGSRVPVEDRLRRRSANVVIRRSEKNLGFAGGVNAAMDLVSSGIVGLVNNDVVLEPGWLATLRSAVESDENVAAVQSVIRGADGAVDGAGIEVTRGMFRQRFHGRPVDEIDPCPDIWGVSATAALFRREALDAVAIDGRVFRPSFFAYYEDVELAARLGEAGWLARLVPEVLATHWASSSASSIAALGSKLRVRNRYWVARLHPGTGSITALVFEDARRTLGLVRRGRGGDALRVPLAVAAGLWARPC